MSSSKREISRRSILTGAGIAVASGAALAAAPPARAEALSLSVNVKAAGAMGDGITDDTAAIQKALDEAKIANADVLIPPGTYSVSNLTLCYDGDAGQPSSGAPYGYRAPVLRGAGNRVPTIRQIPGSVGPILTVSGKTGTAAGPGNNNKASGFTLSDIEIVGTSGGGHGIALRSLVSCSFSNLLIRNCGGSGIYIARETFEAGINDEYAYDLTFTNVKCMANVRWGFECSGTNSVSATLIGCDATGNSLGGYYLAPTNLSMFACVAIQNSQGSAAGYGLQAIRNTNLSSTNATLLLSGCRFEGNSGPGGYDVKIDGGSGYTLEACSYFSTSGAHSVGIGTDAAGASSFVQSPLILGGYFSGDSRTTTAKAIVTSSDCRNLLVVNPRFDFATYGTGGNNTANSLIADGGATTSVLHSQNLIMNAAGWLDWARKIATPGAAPTGMARMYVKDSVNLKGKTQVAIRFPSGAEQILASEPENGADPHRMTWAPAPPTLGTWAKGDVCFNSAPQPSRPPAWSCVASGSPGKWTAWAPLSA
jgi:hypothetical protein